MTTRPNNTLFEIQAKTVLRKPKRVDSWFISGYGMNLYRGCFHNCVYCDGRDEKYNVSPDFSHHIEVKKNAIDLLDRELDPARKRKPMQGGFVLIGGGVNDCYQPAEKQYQMTRKTLKLLEKYHHPAHILTKSILVQRDIDILKRINTQSKALVSFSLSSADDPLSAIFEPGAPPPTRRLETIRMLKDAGIDCGIFLMPVIPFITDLPRVLDQTIDKIYQSGADYVVFGGMTLKAGRQRDYFLSRLKRHYPNLILEYKDLYRDAKYGQASPDYYDALNRLFRAVVTKYKIPVRIPIHLWRDLVSENERVTIVLDQIDYLAKLRGQKSPYGYAGHVISKYPRPLSEQMGNLRSIDGVGPAVEKVIKELLKTGTSKYYEKLLYNQ